MSSFENSSPFLQVLASSVTVVNKAGEAIRDILASDKLEVVEKTGADDLQTKADRYANDLLCASIKNAFPKINVVGEEGPVDMKNIKEDMLVKGTVNNFLDFYSVCFYLESQYHS